MSNYRQGYRDGYADAMRDMKERRGFDVSRARITRPEYNLDVMDYERIMGPIETAADKARFEKMYARRGSKPKRKLSKWQKFVKANSKKKQFIYQSGAKKGKLNLKKMGIAYRRQNK